MVQLTDDVQMRRAFERLIASPGHGSRDQPSAHSDLHANLAPSARGARIWAATQLPARVRDCAHYIVDSPSVECLSGHASLLFAGLANRDRPTKAVVIPAEPHLSND